MGIGAVRGMFLFYQAIAFAAFILFMAASPYLQRSPETRDPSPAYFGNRSGISATT